MRRERCRRYIILLVNVAVAISIPRSLSLVIRRISLAFMTALLDRPLSTVQRRTNAVSHVLHSADLRPSSRGTRAARFKGGINDNAGALARSPISPDLAAISFNFPTDRK